MYLAPELIFAAAALHTDRIKFAPMAHILPHHNPTKLAMTVGWLSQILEGRYFMGIPPIVSVMPYRKRYSLPTPMPKQSA